MPASVSEAASGASTTAGKVNYLANILEAAGASPTTVASVHYYAAINAAALAAEQYIGRPLWEPIDDDQTPNWTQIDDSVPTTWAQINDNQSPGWTDVIQPVTIDVVMSFGDGFFGDVPNAGNVINTYIPDAARWQEIDDTAPTVWTEIVQIGRAHV